MDYEQKYNKLVEAVKILQEANPSDEGIQNWVNDNVPELKESEDERIRGAIMHFISHTPTVPKGIINKEQMLAWLEKQKQKVNKSPLWKKVDQPIYINTKDIALVQKKDQSDLFKGCLLYLDHTLDPKVDERYILLNDLL